ncbi:MAG: phosphatidylglycerol---prolipoprotein diacylglyceryl transferase [Acidobacteriaceae bacterium]|jgi:phosphatidylglycerol:prolipoprotein diacylglycerol transferase|nr:phosphatidylglycerol---prolipoprotein diacylglyceryl transferase [Acidobacteriaceae bacterium]
MYPRFLQFGAFAISTYGVLAALAALCGIALWTSIARRTGLDAAKIQTAGLLAVVCVVVGARLAVVVANWRGFLEAPLLILSAGTLTSGSAAIFGVLLAAVAVVLYLLRAHVPPTRALAAAVPAMVLALAILDIGNFAAGSHYGAPTAVRWGVTYSSRFAARTAGVPLGQALHPVQLYAAIGHFVLAAVLIMMLRKGVRAAEVLGAALFADGVLRFLLAPLSGDYADASALFHIVTPAQAIAMLMVVLGGACWIDPSWRARPSQPVVHHA